MQTMETSVLRGPGRNSVPSEYLNVTFLDLALGVRFIFTLSLRGGPFPGIMITPLFCL